MIKLLSNVPMLVRSALDCIMNLLSFHMNDVIFIVKIGTFLLDILRNNVGYVVWKHACMLRIASFCFAMWQDQLSLVPYIY